jgi:tetratricopeptide (TPR) repeat protein
MINQQDLQAKKQKAWRKMEKGSHSEAMTILRKVIKSTPDDAEALYLTGCCHANLRQWNESIKSLESSIKIQSNVPQTHFALAGARIALGQIDEGIKSINTTLQLNENFPDAYVELANIEIRQEKFDDARMHLERALKIDPKMSDAHLGLGQLEKECGKHQKSISHLEQALKYNSKSVNALCAMANSLANLTQKSEAQIYYRKALKVEPNNVEALSSLAMIYNFNAKYDKAIKLIAPLLRRKVYQSSLAIAYAQACKHCDQCEDALDYINKTLKSSGLSQTEIKGLNFAAGKVLDNMGQYDAAFEHYKAGNNAVTHIYDSVAHTQYVNDVIKVFNPALFMQVPVAQNKDKRPIFIVGMPRSGTSLTEQILAAHPNVCAAGELETLFKISCQMKQDLGGENAFPFYVEKLSQDNVNEMAGTYLDHLTEFSNNAEHVTDKMPHNFYLVGLIQLLFPGAKIIHCQRDPIDTCLSIYFQDFSEAHKYAKDLFNIGTHYYQYQRLMDHWKQVLSIPILDLNYEDLVSNQESETRRILEFCELEWDDSCLQFHNVKRTIDTASFDQVRQPLYTKSVNRWKRYEAHLDELQKGLKRAF